MDKQFIIDVPRLNIYINEELFKKGTQELWDLLQNNFMSNEFPYVVFFLTQTSLSSFYIDEVKNMIKDEHLISDNGYSVKIDTADKKIDIYKKFQKIYQDDELFFNMDFIELSIECDLKNNLMYYNWNYDFEQNDVTVVDKISTSL